jgi:GNAT superfamily N-acetyltransferase
MTGVQVRPARHADFAALAALLDQLGYPVSPARFSRRYERLEADSTVALLVAAPLAGGEVVGAAALQVMPVLEHDAPVGRLIALVVREDARGRGVARALLGEIEDAARRFGCERLIVNSGTERMDAHDAYRSLGFGETGVRFVKDLRATPS